MKAHRRLISALVLGSVVFATLACSSIDSLVSTPVPTATSTPRATRTPKPTNTPIPTDTPEATETPEPTSTPEEAGNVPEDWQLIEITSAGVSISLPKSWIQIDMDPDTLQASVDQAIAQNPALGDMIQGQVAQLLDSGAILFSLDTDPSVQGGVPGSMNILSMDIGVEVPLEMMAQGVSSQLEAQEGLTTSTVEYRLMDTIDGQGAILEYSIKMMINNQEMPLKTMQMLYLDGSTMYMLTMMCLENQFDQYRDTFEQIAYTFQVTG
jgi:hypothetical protein